MLPFNTQTVLLAGMSDLRRWIHGYNSDCLDIVLDSSILEGPAAERFISSLGHSGGDRRVITYRNGRFDGHLRTSSFVIVVGGGSCLDDVKLRIYLNSLGLTELPDLNERCGFLLLPELQHRAHLLAAIPTTLGTGSEVSQVAVAKKSGVRKLVLGAGLAPTIAWHNTDFLQSLPSSLLHEGVLEIFARLLGIFVASQDDTHQPEDAVVRGYVHDMAPALMDGDLLKDSRWQENLLRIGARSHQVGVTYKRPPFGVKWWPIVNEICALTGERKIPVLSLILPQMLVQILEGDDRWGSAVRLRSIWSSFVEIAGPGVSEDPVAGVATLLATDVRHLDLQSLCIPALVERILRAWGEGLPMFRGFESNELENLLEAALVPSHAISVASQEPAHYNN
ncbi:iron-containing alcohol dehydrogenase [Trueperella abortisuis]|uniref:iron-containing alcohol dehydrogenase n=1 Tax=Trueperella abortisuis TaxID=445930 RepID=UPI0035DCC77D